MLDIICIGHKLCLCCKPAYDKCGKLRRMLVRLGHLLENNRNTPRFCDELGGHLRGHFKYRVVFELSAGADRLGQRPVRLWLHPVSHETYPCGGGRQC